MLKRRKISIVIHTILTTVYKIINPSFLCSDSHIQILKANRKKTKFQNSSTLPNAVKPSHISLMALYLQGCGLYAK